MFKGPPMRAGKAWVGKAWAGCDDWLAAISAGDWRVVKCTMRTMTAPKPRMRIPLMPITTNRRKRMFGGSSGRAARSEKVSIGSGGVVMGPSGFGLVLNFATCNVMGAG